MLGQSSTFTFFFFKKVGIILAESLGSLSCWKFVPLPRRLRDDIIFAFNILQYMSPFMIPSIKWSSPTPCAFMKPQTIRLPPPCLTVGTRHFSLYSSPGRRHTFWTPSEPKRLTLVSSDHKSGSQKDNGLSSWLFANCKQACLCLGFKICFLQGRLPCRFAWCTVVCIESGCSWNANTSSFRYNVGKICSTLSLILIDQSSYITCWSDC